jgi:hypothetical protein
VKFGGINIMKNIIKHLFDSKGISVPEYDHPFLVEQIELLNGYKQKIDQMQLNDFDIILRHVPKGGANNE